MAPSQRKEAEERARLVELVKLQGRELDAIKAEISILRYAPCLTKQVALENYTDILEAGPRSKALNSNNRKPSYG